MRVTLSDDVHAPFVRMTLNDWPEPPPAVCEDVGCHAPATAAVLAGGSDPFPVLVCEEHAAERELWGDPRTDFAEASAWLLNVRAEEAALEVLEERVRAIVPLKGRWEPK